MEKLHTCVSVNEFVRRQVKGSGKTYVKSLSFEDIANHAREQLANGSYKPGYRDGVVLVQADKNLMHHYICPFVKISERTELRAQVVRRRPEEETYIQIRAMNGNPLKTSSVDLILYRYDVLAETDEQTTGEDWELISFHAIPEGISDMPMGPATMMRNQLQLPGGTKAYYESKKWAESVKFWQEYAVLEENTS
mgnify:CR=1 FL=1